MNIEQFAQKAGVVLKPCDPRQWGGRIAYAETDRPQMSVCGFRTEKAAYKHWMENKFGKKTAKAVRSLLRESDL